MPIIFIRIWTVVRIWPPIYPDFANRSRLQKIVNLYNDRSGQVILIHVQLCVHCIRTTLKKYKIVTQGNAPDE